MTTIKDIAEYTGVSATTVSNVIHGKKKRVSQETIDKIEAAIKELNYVPNMFARSLVSSASRVVAVINHVPTQADMKFSDESFQMIFLSTLEAKLRESGYFLMFRRVETVEELRMFLQNWNVDGLLIIGICDQDFFEEVSQIALPTVLVDSYCYAEDTCDIGLDDAGGAYLATEHMIKNGHKKIAFTTSDIREGFVMRERLKGYRKALEDYKIPYDGRLVMESAVDLESCRKLADDILAINGITGIVATTDIMAARLMTAFREKGIIVPDDMSIVGFDDTPLAQMTVPPLTTIRQDMVQKASAAADNIVKMLNGEKADNRRVEFPVELIVRESVAMLL